MSSLPVRGARVEVVGDEDADAELMRDELKEDDDELRSDIQHDMDDAASSDRLRQQEELMRLWLQQLAAQQAAGGGGAGQQQQLYPFRPTAAGDEDDDEDADGPQAPAGDESFLGWLRGSLLSSQSLWYYSRLAALKAGQWGWMLGTASALALLPFFLASSAEEQKIRESNLMQQMDARMSFLEQSGGGAVGAPGGHVEIVQPRQAPAGYVTPPMEASGIPKA